MLPRGFTLNGLFGSLNGLFATLNEAKPRF
jgi:hypothetical protein